VVSTRMSCKRVMCQYVKPCACRMDICGVLSTRVPSRVPSHVRDACGRSVACYHLASFVSWWLSVTLKRPGACNARAFPLVHSSIRASVPSAGSLDARPPSLILTPPPEEYRPIMSSLGPDGTALHEHRRRSDHSNFSRTWRSSRRLSRAHGRSIDPFDALSKVQQCELSTYVPHATRIAFRICSSKLASFKTKAHPRASACSRFRSSPEQTMIRAVRCCFRIHSATSSPLPVPPRSSAWIITSSTYRVNCVPQHADRAPLALALSVTPKPKECSNSSSCLAFCGLSSTSSAVCLAVMLLSCARRFPQRKPR
jgi:hypothetical protein